MGDFLRLCLDSIAYLFPFRIVMAWEKANYYVCGKFKRTMGPGLKFIIPFFTEIRSETTVPMVFVTPTQTIMLKNGETLTYSATVTLNVEDLDKAFNTVEKWAESSIELAAAILSDKLADADSGQFEPEKRGRLIASCKTALVKALAEYGVNVSALRFNNFCPKMRVYRLFNESH
jgi:regulator of protease activity HflC (stomatin/prohibitin superfamily)